MSLFVTYDSDTTWVLFQLRTDVLLFWVRVDPDGEAEDTPIKWTCVIRIAIFENESFL